MRQDWRGRGAKEDWSPFFVAGFLLVCLISLIWDHGGDAVSVLGTVRVVIPVAFLMLLGWKSLRYGFSDGIAELRSQKKVWIPFCGLCLLMLIQCLNPSHRYDEATLYLEPLDHIRWLPASVDSSRSWESFLWFLCCCSGYGLSVSCFHHGRTATRGFVTAIVLIGSLHAVLAVAQRITPRLFPVFDFTGRFVYENHFAAFTNLIIPMSVALGVVTHMVARERNVRSHPGFLLYGLGLLMMVAIAYSRSRAGMAVSVFLFALMLLQLLIFLRRSMPRQLRRRITGIVLCSGLVVVVGLVWVCRGPVLSEMKTLSGIGTEISHRSLMYGSMLEVWQTRRWTGTGFGTFGAAFPFYQPENLPGFFEHAHCDALEFLVELGVFGSTLLTALFVGVVYGPKKGSPHRERSNVLSRGALLAFVGLGIHSMIDFPFHLPVTALLASIVLGIWSAGNRVQPSSQRKIS